MPDLGFGTILVKWLIDFGLLVLSRISELLLDIESSLLAFGELDEEVGEARVGEEPLLGLLGVLVHGVSDHLEVNASSLDHLLDILFLEMVAQDDG